MQIVNSLSKHQLVPLVFMQSDVAASQTAVALAPAEVDTPLAIENIGVTMPWGGEIVAISANVSAAATAGTLTVAPTTDTVAATDPILSITTETVKSDRSPRATNVFAADAVIGVDITTSAGWDGTSSGLVVIVWVLLNITGI